jgi:hypothetical protein
MCILFFLLAIIFIIAVFSGNSGGGNSAQPTYIKNPNPKPPVKK